MVRITVGGQTNYAGLLQALIEDEAHQLTMGRTGTFVRKTVKGRAYWYFQYQELGVRKQVYVGPQSATLDGLKEQHGAETLQAKDRQRHRQRLVAMAKAAGLAATPAPEVDVLAHLADCGLFHAGAVVVGSLAFTTLGNVLGVELDKALGRTADIDVATDPSLLIALAKDVNLKAVDAARFSPIPSLSRKAPSTSFRVRGTELTLDLLAPLVGKPKDSPTLLPELGAAAHPLRFLDFVLEDSIQAAIVGQSGVLVNVPDPARFALHKCIVAQERSLSFRAKKVKDLAQANALLEVLLVDEPGAVSIAWSALQTRGPGWVKRASKSLEELALLGTLKAAV